MQLHWLVAGQHNIHQRIQHHQKVKDENNALKGQLAASREDAAKATVRLAYLQATPYNVSLLCCNGPFDSALASNVTRCIPC